MNMVDVYMKALDRPAALPTTETGDKEWTVNTLVVAVGPDMNVIYSI